MANSILIVNQVFYPDEVAVSQYLTDFSEQLLATGHTITVVAGGRDYENPKLSYSHIKEYKSINITHIASGGFSKKTIIGRLLNFGTFNFGLFLHLLLIRRSHFDVIVGSTVPPMVAFTTSIFCAIKRIPFVLWVMDLQPDEAVAAGYLSPQSITAKLLSLAGRISLTTAKSIIVLDKYMKNRIVTKGIPSQKVTVVPLWSVMSDDTMDNERGKHFRQENSFEGKTIVMYSGNHSVCHPLDTLLEAAKELRDSPEFLFVFIGSGVRVGQVSNSIRKFGLSNAIQLPYQKRADLPASLLSADIHIVVMGDPFVGIIHPSKIYGILATGRPFILIGPDHCHVGDMIRAAGIGFDVRHGDVTGLVATIKTIQKYSDTERMRFSAAARTYVFKACSRSRSAGQLVDIVEKSFPSSNGLL